MTAELLLTMLGLWAVAAVPSIGWAVKTSSTLARIEANTANTAGDVIDLRDSVTELRQRVERLERTRPWPQLPGGDEPVEHERRRRG